MSHRPIHVHVQICAFALAQVPISQNPGVTVQLQQCHVMRLDVACTVG